MFATSTGGGDAVMGVAAVGTKVKSKISYVLGVKFSTLKKKRKKEGNKLKVN